MNQQSLKLNLSKEIINMRGWHYQLCCRLLFRNPILRGYGSSRPNNGNFWPTNGGCVFLCVELYLVYIYIFIELWYIMIHTDIPVVPARGGAEVALKIYIRPFSSIELACAVRQRSPCVRALCETGVLFHMSHLKLHVTLHTPHFTLHTALFALHTSHCTLRTPNFTLHTSHFSLLTPHFTLHTLHSTLHTSHCFLKTPHFILHTLHVTVHTSHFSLLSPHSTLLHSTEKLLHTASFHTQQAFTHRTLTHSAFTHGKRLHTHTDTFTQRRFYTQRSFYTQQTFTHTTFTQQAFTHSKRLHTVLAHSAFTHGKRLHTEHLHTVLLHMASFYTHTQKLLHRDTFNTCTDKLLDTANFTHNIFYTQQAFTHSKRLDTEHLHTVLAHTAFTHGKRLHTQTFTHRNCSSKTGSRRQSRKKTILKDRKLLAPKLRKSADKWLSQPGCSHSNTIYNLQLQKTIVLRMQPLHQATLRQPLQCNLQRLSCKAQ